MVAVELEELEKVDIRTVDASTLADIGKIRIDRTLPKEERLLTFIREVKNPCFICNGMVVKTSFSDTDENLESKLAKLCARMAGI